MICIHCSNEFTPKNKIQKFCNIKCKNSHNNKIYQPYHKQKDKGTATRLFLIKEFGGKCSKCNYNKNIAALCFHHLDESTKKFQIDLRNCSNKSYKTLKIEANKCILLCTNCHMEEHYPYMNNLIT